MKAAMTELFWANTELIVFLHVISAVIWVGGMVAMRFAAHQ
jgi:putative copper export protein